MSTHGNDATSADGARDILAETLKLTRDLKAHDVPDVYVMSHAAWAAIERECGRPDASVGAEDLLSSPQRFTGTPVETCTNDQEAAELASWLVEHEHKRVCLVVGQCGRD